MPLSLTVPVSTRPLPKEIETNPKKARQWVEALPLTKTVDSAKIVAANIEALNRGKLTAEERVALIEVYRPVTEVLLDELDAIYAFASLPLPPKQKEAFDLAHLLSAESSFAYKMLVLEKTGKFIAFGTKKALLLPIYRILTNQLALMVQSYKTYHPVPVGVWQEASSLYLYAEEQGFAKEVVEAEAKSSVADIYYEMLMLSLADPYRLMYREVDRVLEVLRQNRGQVEFRSSVEGIDQSRAFVVAFDADTAPKPLVLGNHPPPGNVLRLVDPTKLVERLQQKLKAASNNTALTAAKSRATNDTNDLIGRLIRLWGDPPKRQFRRNPADTGVALCAGIKAISYFAELALNEKPEADAEAIREGRTIPLLKIPQDPMSQLIGVEEWHVLNQSANGLRMHRNQGGNVGVTVGEVIGVRFVGGRAWNIGVVRWLTLLDGNALEFGMELLSPAGYAVTMEPTIGSNGRPIQAVLLASTNPEFSSDTVMSVADTFADLREFELNDHGETTTVRAMTLVERTSKFDLFQFQPS
jgi:cyclic-di-GMP-binding protein